MIKEIREIEAEGARTDGRVRSLGMVKVLAAINAAGDDREVRVVLDSESACVAFRRSIYRYYDMGVIRGRTGLMIRTSGGKCEDGYWIGVYWGLEKAKKTRKPRGYGNTQKKPPELSAEEWADLHSKPVFNEDDLL